MVPLFLACLSPSGTLGLQVSWGESNWVLISLAFYAWGKVSVLQMGVKWRKGVLDLLGTPAWNSFYKIGRNEKAGNLSFPG